MKFMFGLQHPLTCNPSTTLSNPCKKVRGKNIVNEVFLRLYHVSFIPAFSFLRPLFLRLLSLRRYVSRIYMYATSLPIIWVLFQVHHLQLVSPFPSFFIFIFIFHAVSAGRAKSTIQQVLSFLCWLSLGLVVWPILSDLFVTKNPRDNNNHI